MGFVDSFGGKRLAGECRLVDTQCDGIDEFGIGRYLVACVEHYYVTHNDVTARNRRDVAIAENFDGLVVVDAVENPECFIGP